MSIKPLALDGGVKAWAAGVFDVWNTQQGFVGKHEEFCFEYLDEDRARVGVVYGRFFAGWCGVTDLAVDEKARGKGVGKALMLYVEEVARSKSMQGIYLTTISFQAPKFYEKIGYTCYATLDNYAGGQRLHFKKELR
jgi:GNAT superfamily N-acetyltransferase